MILKTPLRVRDVLLDEDINPSFFPSVSKVPKSVFAILPRGRNPFEILKKFPTIPLAPEKKTMAGIQVEGELIVQATEQAPNLNFAEPKNNNGCKKATGSTSIDQGFKIPIAEESLNESLSERINEKKAHFISIKSNYEFCPKISVDNSTLLMQKKCFRLPQKRKIQILLVQGPIFLQIMEFTTISCVPKEVNPLMLQKFSNITSASKSPSTMFGLPY